MGYIKKVGLTFLAVGCALLFSTCNTPSSEKDTSDGDSSGTLDGETGKIAFWVKLNLSDDVIAKYQVVRAFIVNDDSAQIGNTSGPFSDRFKITVPEEYAETEQRFIVEFLRVNSPLDEIVQLQQFPIALGILKAFYYEIPNDTIAEKPLVPPPGGELVLPPDGEIKTADLKMGYGPKSIDILQNIPNLPKLYKIDLDLTDTGIVPYIADWYRAQLGVVTKISSAGEPAGLGIDPMSSTLFDPNTVAGVCGGDDWYMVMTDTTLKKDDRVRIWVIFTNSPMPRLYYKDIQLPDDFGTIPLKPNFAAIPIINEGYFQLMLLASGIHSGINFDLPAPFDVLTSSESYVLTKSKYDFSTNPALPVSLPSSIPLPPLHPWNPYPTITIGVPISTSDIFSNFSGRFDGAGYRITGLHYTISSGTALPANYGFFAGTSGADIVNVNLEISSASGEVAAGWYLGGLVGKAGNTTVDTVSVTGPSLVLDGKAQSGNTHVGGIAGVTNNFNSITNFTQNVATLVYNYVP
jgi:hypothetical protein